MHFCQSFGVSKFLTGRENGSQKALPDGNLALKIAYRTGIWLSKALPDGNWVLKVTLRLPYHVIRAIKPIRESGHDENLAIT